MPELRRYWLLGLPVDVIDMRGALDICLARLDSAPGRALRVVTVNPEMIVRAGRERDLAESIRRADLAVPDGIGVVLAGRAHGWRDCVRVPGIELCEQLVAAAADRGWPVYLYGGFRGIAERAATALQTKYPRLMVAGTSHGYLNQEEEAVLTAKIAASGARLLLVGTGLPHQELWLGKYLQASGAWLGMGVGGSFDVFAGRIPRAPRIMRRAGLEWAFRLWREPRRWRRILVLPVFMIRALLPGSARRPGGAKTAQS